VRGIDRCRLGEDPLKYGPISAVVEVPVDVALDKVAQEQSGADKQSADHQQGPEDHVQEIHVSHARGFAAHALTLGLEVREGEKRSGDNRLGHQDRPAGLPFV
jgi:hypothetical protein